MYLMGREHVSEDLLFFYCCCTITWMHIIIKEETSNESQELLFLNPYNVSLYFGQVYYTIVQNLKQFQFAF